MTSSTPTIAIGISGSGIIHPSPAQMGAAYALLHAEAAKHKFVATQDRSSDYIMVVIFSADSAVPPAIVGIQQRPAKSPATYVPPPAEPPHRANSDAGEIAREIARAASTPM